MLNKSREVFLKSPRTFFFLNSAYYLVQLVTFFYISSLALPKDIGISSYVISLAGIFAVIARYGMPVYMVEGVSDESSLLDKYFIAASSFSFTVGIFLLPISFFVILQDNFNQEFILLTLLGTSLMIFLNPISMIIDQMMILKKQRSFLSINSIIKTFIFPLSAYFTYQFTNNFAATIIFANVSILVSPIIVYYFLQRKFFHFNYRLLNIEKFFTLIKEAFPYFINSLALILILSIDKIFVGNIFSIEILGSYDLMWKCAILIDFILMQPINSLFARDIINSSIKSGLSISLSITFLTLLTVFLIYLINFDFLLPLWNLFFEKYEFNTLIFKLSVSFFILMFAVNQLRNLMANLKLRFMCTISSCIIPLPLIITASFFEIKLLSSVPTLIIIGVSTSLIFNLITYNYFNFKNTKK